MLHLIQKILIAYFFLQVALDLVNPSSVLEKLVNVVRVGSVLAAYLPKLALSNKYSAIQAKNINDLYLVAHCIS